MDGHAGVPEDTRPEDTGQLRFICSFGQGRRGLGVWDFKGNAGSFVIRQHVVNRFLLGHPETMGTRNLANRFSLGSFLFATFNSNRLR